MTTQLVLETPKQETLDISRFIKQTDCHLFNSDVTEPFLTPCHSSVSAMFSLHHPFADPNVEEDIPLMNIAHEMPGPDLGQVHGHLGIGERMRVSSTGSDQSSSGRTPDTTDSLSSSTDEVMNVESHLDSVKNALRTNSVSLANSGRKKSLSEPGHLNGLGGSRMIVVSGFDNPLGDCMEVTSLDLDTEPVSSLGEKFHNGHTGRDSTNITGLNFQTMSCEFSESITPLDLKHQAPDYEENLQCGGKPTDTSTVLISDTGQQVHNSNTFDKEITNPSLRGKFTDEKSVHIYPEGNDNFNPVNSEMAASYAASHHSYRFSTTSSNTAASTTPPVLQQQPPHSSIIVETDSSNISSTQDFEHSPQIPVNSKPQQLHHTTHLLCPNHLYGFACSGSQSGQLPAARHVLALDSAWQPTAALLCSSPATYYDSNLKQQNEAQSDVITMPITNLSDFPFQVMIPVSCASANPLAQYSNLHVLKTFSENPNANIMTNKDERSNSEQKSNIEQCSNRHAPETNLSRKQNLASCNNSTIPSDSNKFIHQAPILQVMVPRYKPSQRQNHFDSNPLAFSHKPLNAQMSSRPQTDVESTVPDVESTIHKFQQIAGSNASDYSNQTSNMSIPNNISRHEDCGVEGSSSITLQIPFSGFRHSMASASSREYVSTEATLGVRGDGKNVIAANITNASNCAHDLQIKPAQIDRLVDPLCRDDLRSNHNGDYNGSHYEKCFSPGDLLRVHEGSIADDPLIEIPLRQNQEDRQSSSFTDVTDLKPDNCCSKISIPFCLQASHRTQDHNIPDYRCLSVVACLVNPVIGALALVTNALAKHYHRRRKYNYAQNFYMATIVLGSLAIYSTITITCLVAILLQECHHDPPVKPKHCTPNLKFMNHFGMDEELYCRNMKNTMISEALRRYYSFPNFDTTGQVLSQHNDSTVGSGFNNKSSRSNDSHAGVQPATSMTDNDNGTEYLDDFSSSSTMVLKPLAGKTTQQLNLFNPGSKTTGHELKENHDDSTSSPRVLKPLARDKNMTTIEPFQPTF